MSSLTALTDLSLGSNQITDISPLVANTGLGSGTSITLTDNPLSADARKTQIPALEERGVKLFYGTIVTFENDSLEAVVRVAINKSEGDILTTDVYELTELVAGNKNISSLSGIENLTALKKLYLSGNQINDLSPLSSLTALTELYLGVNQISDLSPLSSLTALTWLYLIDNQITDLSPLSSLTALTYLDLNNNPLSADARKTQIPALEERGVKVIR